MKGPSIAVMLGSPKHDTAEDEAEQGDLSLAETKQSANDAAAALSVALKSGDAPRIVKAFCALSTLARHLEDLEEDGEPEADDAGEYEGGEDDGSDEG